MLDVFFKEGYWAFCTVQWNVLIGNIENKWVRWRQTKCHHLKKHYLVFLANNFDFKLVCMIQPLDNFGCLPSNLWQQLATVVQLITVVLNQFFLSSIFFGLLSTSTLPLQSYID